VIGATIFEIAAAPEIREGWRYDKAIEARAPVRYGQAKGDRTACWTYST
jgi:hypothetical protein